MKRRVAVCHSNAFRSDAGSICGGLPDSWQSSPRRHHWLGDGGRQPGDLCRPKTSCVKQSLGPFLLRVGDLDRDLWASIPAKRQAPDFQAPVEFEMAQLWSILPRMAKFLLCGSVRIEGVEGYVLFTRFGMSPPRTWKVLSLST